MLAVGDTESMATDYKFGSPEPEDREWAYRNVWATEKTTGGGNRLVIGPAHGQTEILGTLLKDMTGPFWVAVRSCYSPWSSRVGQISKPRTANSGSGGSFSERILKIP
jgi:hypothetical protein